MINKGTSGIVEIPPVTTEPARDGVRADGRVPAVERPEPPTLVIEPIGRWSSIDWKELWAYRELFYFMVWKDLKVRYQQTVLGVGWALLQPLLTTILFTIIFGRLARVPSNGVPYPVFALAAMVPWFFFSSAYTNASTTLIGHATMLSKVYFPRLIFPLTPVLVGLVDLAVSALLLVGAMVIYGVAPSVWALLLVPYTVLLLVMTTVGVGCLLAALSLEFRDVKHVLPFLTQIWMFATPIVYPLSLVPERWQPLYALNPLAGVVSTFRASLFGLPIPWMVLGISTLSSIAALFLGVIHFRRTEPRFADIA